ncbi:MAG: fumarylacetoacetate hydrolase family protein [Phototrophicaceae bacterium]
MKLLMYHTDKQLKIGIVTEQGIVDILAEARRKHIEFASDQKEFYQQASHWLTQIPAILESDIGSDNIYEESSLTIAPIVPTPSKIVCIGLNYRRHALESNMVVPKTPILFSKFSNSIAGSGDVIPLPSSSQQCDYEAELVVVMGKTADNVSVENALDYVLGYCNGNDISARDLQLLTSQWLLGKTLDKFLPIGPYLVTADAIPNPQNLRIQTWYQGELRQNSSTEDMVFSVAEIISYVSHYFPLQSGDIIATGTPEGVILGDKNPKWMQAGDEVIIEIEGLGRLENKMG